MNTNKYKKINTMLENCIIMKKLMYNNIEYELRENENMIAYDIYQNKKNICDIRVYKHKNSYLVRYYNYEKYDSLYAILSKSEQYYDSVVQVIKRVDDIIV